MKLPCKKWNSRHLETTIDMNATQKNFQEGSPFQAGRCIQLVQLFFPAKYRTQCSYALIAVTAMKDISPNASVVLLSPCP